MSRSFTATAGCGLLLCLVTTAVVAEQRFYQVIDAQGRMQTIMAPESKPKAEKPAEPQSGSDVFAVEGKSDTDAPATTVSVPENKAVDETRPSEKVTPAAAATQATDEYVDSELLESTNFNPTNKKRFYVVNDGMGSRVEESENQLAGTDGKEPTFFSAGPVEPFTPVVMELIETADEQVLKSLINAESFCLGEKELTGASTLSRNSSFSVIIDRKTRQFLGAGGVVRVLRVSGDGLRKLAVSSYSKTERKPGFVIPVLAMANEKGCVIRAVQDGYYERRYVATKTRHERLEGSIIMMSAERFLLVVLPDPKQLKPASEIPRTDDGDFAVQWHE
ncbi:MAG TPA: hypothetical protein DF427_00750 [Moraxellaceae bacterium]|nr:hypothetical protein [Moraxellaceae bacterium]